MAHVIDGPRRESAGRPPVLIDWQVVDSFLRAGCPTNEILSEIGCHRDTLYDRCIQEKGLYWSEYSAQVTSNGKARIRLKQYDVALSGNTTLLVHVGKYLLGQKEEKKQENDESGPRAIEDLAKSLDGGNQEISSPTESQGSPVANQQPILHQEQQGTEGTVSSQLGSEGASGDSSSV